MIKSFSLDSDTLKKMDKLIFYFKSQSNGKFKVNYSSIVRYAINYLYDSLF